MVQCLKATDRAMTDTTGNLEPVRLAGDFPEADEAQWRAAASAALKGGDVDKQLLSKVIGGLTLAPVYEPTPSAAPIGRVAAGRPWRVAQRLDHPAPDDANRLILKDLEGGADMVSLVFPASPSAAGYGVACDSVTDLDAALAGVGLEMIRLRVEPAPAGRINGGLVAALVEKRGLDPTALDVTFGLDPIGSLAAMGSFSASWAEVGTRLADSVNVLKRRGFKGPFIECDVRQVHAAGGSEDQELAAAVAYGLAYMRALEAAGMPLADAERALQWTFAIDADQFLGLAKLRAMRRLWARVQQGCGLEAAPIAIHAETAWRMMTKRDPAVNMLRATIATFTAGVGGADSITVLPHTLAVGLPNALARRIARNTQVVLLEESNLWRVCDPAAGAGAFETLCEQLCSRAWEGLQQIEREGGIVESLSRGAFQDRVRACQQQRAKLIATGRMPLTGTSAYPALDERPADVLTVSPDPKRGMPARRGGNPKTGFSDLIATLAYGASRGHVTPPPEAVMTAESLVAKRLSEPFEALRDAADAAAARGDRPAVFIANLGPLADNTVRTMWLKNLLAAGGIEGRTVVDGFTNSADVGRAFAQSGLTIACLAGSDEAYGQLVDATAALLKTVGAKRVYIARRPADPAVTTTGVGIDGHLYAGQDMVAALCDLHQALSV